jgi:zinc protease
MQRSRVGVVLAAVIAASSSGCRSARDREWMRLETSGSRFESSNGYVFIVLPDPSVHMVRVDVRYPVGSARDPAGKEGVAHLVEHLLFAVQVDREGGLTSISAELARLAHYWNAETALDYTHYVAQGTPDSLDGLLRLEAERTLVGCRGITPAVFEREKEIVVNELRQRQGAAGSLLIRRLNQALYPGGHPYRRADSVDAVRRIQPADVCRFLRESYPLGKAVVVVSGAVTEAKVRDSARRHFAAMPQRDLAGLEVPAVVAPAPGRVRVRADVDELTLLASWPLPPRSSREFRLLEAVWDFIPDRLGWFARNYEWGHSPWSGVIGGQHAPQLLVAVALDSPGDLDEAVAAVEKSVAGSFRDIYRAATGPNAYRWRQTWLPQAAALVSRYESIGERAELMAELTQLESDQAGLIGRVRDLDRARPAEVRRIAEKWLDPDRARYVLVEPDAGAVERVNSISSFVERPEIHRVPIDLAEAERPLEIPPVSLAIPTTRFRTGGLEVVVWKGSRTPLLRAALVVDSGTAHEPPGREGVAALQGADADFDDHLVWVGTDFGHEAQWLVSTVSAPVHNRNVALSARTKKILRARLRRSLAEPRRRYELDLLRALYGPNHPYARSSLTERSLAAIDADALVAWRREHAVTSNATLILAGDVDGEAVDEQLERLADDFTAGRDSPDVTARPITAAGFVLGAAGNREPQVQLDVAFVGGRGIDRDHALRLLVGEILDARLSALREEDALSYGFGASYAPRIAGGMWRVSGRVPAARAAEAARLLVRALDDMRSSPDAYRADFVHARRKLVEGLAGSGADSGAILERLVLIERFRLDAGFFDRLLSEIARLQIDQVHAFVTREFASGGRVFGALGPRESASAALAAARQESGRPPQPAAAP